MFEALIILALSVIAISLLPVAVMVVGNLVVLAVQIIFELGKIAIWLSVVAMLGIGVLTLYGYIGQWLW